MTESEAIKYLNREILRGNMQNDTQTSAYELAIKALEKQIPLKPDRPKMDRLGYTYEDYSCSICGHFFGYESGAKETLKSGYVPTIYCQKCGQRLNWSE